MLQFRAESHSPCKMGVNFRSVPTYMYEERLRANHRGFAFTSAKNLTFCGSQRATVLSSPGEACALALLSWKFAGHVSKPVTHLKPENLNMRLAWSHVYSGCGDLILLGRHKKLCTVLQRVGNKPTLDQRHRRPCGRQVCRASQGLGLESGLGIASGGTADLRLVGWLET